MTNVMTEVFGEVIHSYTRAQALEDGYLVDVSTTAKEAGFKCPVALTRAVWDRYVEWDEADNKAQRTYQDQEGRLWDVLWMAFCAIKRSRNDDPEMLYEFFCVPRDGKSRKAKLAQVKMVIGPGDQGEMVITIMAPEED